MPVFLVPLYEHNDCHSPAGSPEGGQFCSDEGRGLHALLTPAAVRASLQRVEAETFARQRQTAGLLNALPDGLTIKVGRTMWTKTQIGTETFWTSKKGGKTSEQMSDDIATFIKAGLIPRDVVQQQFPHHERLLKKR